MNRDVQPKCGNLRRWRKLYRALARVETLEQRAMLSVNPAPAPVGVQPSGALSGRVVYTKGGHGYTWMNGLWETQRPYINNMVEDMGNQDQDTYFAHYLLQAGATVVPARPVDHQKNESVIDNSQAYSAATGGFDVESGSWGSSTQQPYWSNNNGNDTAHYRFATIASTETAVSRFTANIPVAGYYPVYAWAKTDTDRVKDQTFRINYAGGSYEVRVNLLFTGNGWIYLGNYYFNAGVSQTQGSVEVSNKSSMAGTNPGDVVIADAIRYGNGMGDFVPSGAPGVSGQPREEEAALYWDYDSRGWTANGTRVAQSVVDAGSSSDDYTKDFAASDRWATYMNNSSFGSMYDRLWISFHTNASGSSGAGRGTLGLINTVPTANQPNLAKLAGTNVTNELTAVTTAPGGGTAPGYDGTWGSQNPPDHTFTGGYSEISDNVINGEFDATIIEVAFHDNTTDAKLLEDPKVRDAVARATLHTAIDYFHNPVGDGSVTPLTNTTFLPEPPTDVRSTTDATGKVTISWSPGPTSNGTTGPYGNAATSYKVYTSSNGIGFDGGVTVTGATTLTFSGSATNAPTYFRVTSLNAGGESFGSPVVAAKPQPAALAEILIVNNFSRLDRGGDPLETNINLEVTGAQTFDRVNSLFNNSRNYVAQAAGAISAFNSSFGIDSCSDSAIAAGEIALGKYQAVVWMSGEQSSVDRTFTATTQPLVTSYLNAGGKMFISGSEIGLDLVASGHGSSFFTSTLKANYPLVGGSYTTSDDANTHSASGNAGSIFAGISLAFDNGTNGTYDVDFPDTIAAPAGTVGVSSAMTYVGGTGTSAGIQYASPSNPSKIVFLGFPFEAITTAVNRNAVMAAVLGYFGVVIPSATPGTPDLVTASDSGVSNSDDITNLNNAAAASALSFSVSGTVAGATVTILADGNPIGSAIAGGTTTTVATDGSSILGDGSHVFTAIQTEPGKPVSSALAGLSVTVDTTAPTISPMTFNYQTSQSVSYSFNENIATSFAPASIVVTNLTANSTMNTLPSYNSGTHVVTYSLAGGVLADGNYQAVLDTSGMTDAAGNVVSPPATGTFFFQRADGNRDRAVNALDFGIIAANYGLSGGTFSQGDYNYDGAVDTGDFTMLAAEFGANLPAAPAPAESVAPLTAANASSIPGLFGSHRIADGDAIDSVLA